MHISPEHWLQIDTPQGIATMVGAGLLFVATFFAAARGMWPRSHRRKPIGADVRR